MENDYYELHEEMGKDIHFEVNLELMQRLLDRLNRGEWQEYGSLNLKCEKVLEVDFSINQNKLNPFLENLKNGDADLTDLKKLISEKIDYFAENNAEYHIPRYRVRLDENEHNEVFGDMDSSREKLWELREEKIEKLETDGSFDNEEMLMRIFNDRS